MSKYRISVSINEKNYFWMVIDNGKLIKNPTKEDLMGTKLISYDKTNICPICREENNIIDKSILYPKNARREKDKNGNETGRWICASHRDRYRNRYDENSIDNLKKQLARHRTGKFNDARQIFSSRCEKLSVIYFGVDNLNIKNDNYCSPIDHSRCPILGILQTKGSIFSRDVGANGGWKIGYRIVEHEKQYDNMIIWCASKNGKVIERGYIIPKKEIDKRLCSISIVKSSSRNEPWYDQYKIKDEEEIKKINEIWKEIISENEKK